LLELKITIRGMLRYCGHYDLMNKMCFSSYCFYYIDSHMLQYLLVYFIFTFWDLDDLKIYSKILNCY